MPKSQQFLALLLVAGGAVLGYAVAAGMVPALREARPAAPGAGQTTGEPGAPNATTTIDGRYLSSCDPWSRIGVQDGRPSQVGLQSRQACTGTVYLGAARSNSCSANSRNLTTDPSGPRRLLLS